jgi:hypothetical protein
MLQAKGQLHGGAQGVLPRHKNADCKRELAEKKEEELDYWFNRLGPMTKPKETWQKMVSQGGRR